MTTLAFYLNAKRLGDLVPMSLQDFNRGVLVPGQLPKLNSQVFLLLGVPNLESGNRLPRFGDRPQSQNFGLLASDAPQIRSWGDGYERHCVLRYKGDSC
jgi:hypothetical protein